MERLTDRALRNLKATGTAYKVADGSGLYVDVGRTGKRVWRYRFRFDGRQTTVTLGEYPALGLKDARDLRREKGTLVRDGKHPGHEHRAEVAQEERERQAEREREEQERRNAFEPLAREWVAEKLRIPRSAGYCHQIIRALERHVFPTLGSRPVRSIERSEVREVLRAVGRNAGQAQALLVRGWVGGAFRYGIAMDKCEHDPCANLHGAVPEHLTRPHRTIQARDIPAFTAALESNTTCPRSVRLYLWLLLLSFVRPTELREARWAEIDWQTCLWRIPAERMKSRRDHLVPLSTQAITKLRELQALSMGSEFIFPGTQTPRKLMHRSTARGALRRLGWLDQITPHGFRSLASTTLNEMGWRPDVTEMQLAHLDANKTRATYNRAAYLQERMRMMQAWGDFVMTSNVVPLRATA